MATNAEIPTEAGRPFTERVGLSNGITYTLRFYWNSVAQCWHVDFSDTGGLPILMGVPLVTGVDLLEQYGYMPLGARQILTAMTIGPDLSPDTVPTFTNLGIEGHLYVTSPGSAT